MESTTTQAATTFCSYCNTSHVQPVKPYTVGPKFTPEGAHTDMALRLIAYGQERKAVKKALRLGKPVPPTPNMDAARVSYNRKKEAEAALREIAAQAARDEYFQLLANQDHRKAVLRAARTGEYTEQGSMFA
jgi:hypothetical protein